MTMYPLTALLSQLWNDDGGAVLASEYLTLGSIVVLGGAAGLATLRDSVNDEMKEFGGALRTMRQSYSVSGARSGVASVPGSGAVNNPSHGSSSIGADFAP